MFYPHEIFKYLMDVGLEIDMNAVQSYWGHLTSLDNPWAKNVNDNSLIPMLGQ